MSREHLDYKPNKTTSTTKEPPVLPKSNIDTSNMTLRQKLKVLNELVVDSLIEGVSTGMIKPMELQGAITLLKNNKEVEDRKEHSESDLIDSLIEDKRLTYN